MRSEMKVEILRQYGVLSENTTSGWKKELNLVAWNEREPKLDVRDWSPDHTKMGKGITLTLEEAQELAKLINAMTKKPKESTTTNKKK